MFDIGVARVTLHSAGGAVTEHTMIRDVIVHEEYRSRGMEVQLNDIGKFSTAGLCLCYLLGIVLQESLQPGSSESCFFIAGGILLPSCYMFILSFFILQTNVSFSLLLRQLTFHLVFY